MVALLVWLSLQMPAGAAVPNVTCLGRGSAEGREFVLERMGATGPWRLRYRDREHQRWITLTLPGATPVLASGTARLQFRNANGGRQVEVDVVAGKARLDIYVDYGLDVNIDADLDPEVDRMNTDGPLTSLECQVNP
jgi:hypothetical protein